MKPHITLITLGVADLARAARFYERLGLSRHPMPDGADVAFFALRGAWLGLYGWRDLAEDAHTPAEGSGFRGVTLAHNVESPEAVDAVLAEAVAAGATLRKPGQPTPWGGYSGYFADPDGHLWEVAHNPFMDFA